MRNFIPKVTAKAHCDIPCGIYEPTPAKIAAKTVLRMVEQLEVFKPPKDSSDSKSMLQYQNAISRRILVKEKHAQICKKELYILWSDFFKPEHLEKFPNLHDLFWKATKLCSKNKQEVDKEAAQELVATVDEIAKIFYGAKKTPERFKAYKEITDKLY
ncbi:MAG: superoxide dismutase, Ni [Candidatus Nealsonbacteria bacterium RBG_13_36_15]|uniref:Superoxide dismutase, Ni n=1 Tax=Candidatus Nealsonbacteria bacterium RBG_13_36_15 TaxID=1801660 RepID=A0A1G2DWW4_9BACT|nr:MAG: superoxide dismutase, Ni [Candidatus Nealsonbacteria bacterium RBG_13_36_15]